MIQLFILFCVLSCQNAQDFQMTILNDTSIKTIKYLIWSPSGYIYKTKEHISFELNRTDNSISIIQNYYTQRQLIFQVFDGKNEIEQKKEDCLKQEKENDEKSEEKKDSDDKDDKKDKEDEKTVDAKKEIEKAKKGRFKEIDIDKYKLKNKNDALILKKRLNFREIDDQDLFESDNKNSNNQYLFKENLDESTNEEKEIVDETAKQAEKEAKKKAEDAKKKAEEAKKKAEEAKKKAEEALLEAFTKKLNPNKYKDIAQKAIDGMSSLFPNGMDVGKNKRRNSANIQELNSEAHYTKPESFFANETYFANGTSIPLNKLPCDTQFKIQHEIKNRFIMFRFKLKLKLKDGVIPVFRFQYIWKNYSLSFEFDFSSYGFERYNKTKQQEEMDELLDSNNELMKDDMPNNANEISKKIQDNRFKKNKNQDISDAAFNQGENKKGEEEDKSQKDENEEDE